MVEKDTVDSTAQIKDSPSLEEADLAQIDEASPEPASISYDGTDFDVEGLVRRLDRGDIVIPTFGHGDPTVETAGFQRDFVWRRAQMDRFVESLLLGYPVPGIFLVQQRDKRYLVLDGQQRLRTLAHFYKGTFAKREFSLQNVSKDLIGITYESLDETQRRALNNSFIQAIVVRTDGTPSSLESVYQIFERLNSGGTQLTGHEIRVALYAGPFIDFVASLNELPEWRRLYGETSPRLRDQELILRILALFVSPGTYKRPLKRFLNRFVGENRDCSRLDVAALKARFVDACSVLNENPGPQAFRFSGSQVNTAMTEAVMVGLMRRLEAGSRPNSSAVAATIHQLVGSTDFANAVTRATADEENVKARLAKATKELAAT